MVGLEDLGRLDAAPPLGPADGIVEPFPDRLDRRVEDPRRQKAILRHAHYATPDAELGAHRAGLRRARDLGAPRPRPLGGRRLLDRRRVA